MDLRAWITAYLKNEHLPFNTLCYLHPYTRDMLHEHGPDLLPLLDLLIQRAPLREIDKLPLYLANLQHASST
jgi:hypothetical protein